MTDIPGVHVSAEHQCTIWCNQLAQTAAHLLLIVADRMMHAVANDSSLKVVGNSSISTAAACLWGPGADSSLTACRPAEPQLFASALPQTELQPPSSAALRHEGRCVLREAHALGSMHAPQLSLVCMPALRHTFGGAVHGAWQLPCTSLSTHLVCRVYNVRCDLHAPQQGVTVAVAGRTPFDTFAAVLHCGTGGPLLLMCACMRCRPVQ